MSDIHFYNNKRDKIISLKDFHHTSNNNERVFFNVNIKTTLFVLDICTESEISDFIDFRNGLKKIYSHDLNNIYFSPLGGDIQIHVTNIENELQWKCEIHDNMFTQQIEISYTYDQSFLPELINELSDVLQSLGSE